MRSASLSKDAYQQIIRMIFDGRLQRGDVLQEARLGEELGMSRTPIREAIKRIEGEGLAEQVGRFLRVHFPSPDEIWEVFFIRLQLEPQAARSAVRLPAEQIDVMRHRIEKLMAAGPDNDSGEHWRVDDDFHAMVAGATGNNALVRLIANMRRRTCMFDSNQVPVRFAKGCEEHLSILAALRVGDANTAEKAMIRHIEGARDAILDQLQTKERDRCRE